MFDWCLFCRVSGWSFWRISGIWARHPSYSRRQTGPTWACRGRYRWGHQRQHCSVWEQLWTPSRTPGLGHPWRAAAHPATITLLIFMFIFKVSLQCKVICPIGFVILWPAIKHDCFSPPPPSPNALHPSTHIQSGTRLLDLTLMLQAHWNTYKPTGILSSFMAIKKLFYYCKVGKCWVKCNACILQSPIFCEKPKCKVIWCHLPCFIYLWHDYFMIYLCFILSQFSWVVCGL